MRLSTGLIFCRRLRMAPVVQTCRGGGDKSRCVQAAVSTLWRMLSSLSRPHSRLSVSRPSAAVAMAWLALGVAVVTSTLVVTNIRPVYLRFGLDRVSGMSWITFYAVTAAVSGCLALVVLRWPRKVTVTIALALVFQFVFVKWVAGHGGACVFGCGPFIS
jgi:hypothetical protein